MNEFLQSVMIIFVYATGLWVAVLSVVAIPNIYGAWKEYRDYRRKNQHGLFGFKHCLKEKTDWMWRK